MDSSKQAVFDQIICISFYASVLLLISVFLNVVCQLFFYNRNEPPVVFHWFPVVGSAIQYGRDPYAFFFSCRQKVCVLYQIILLIGSNLDKFN